MGVDAFIYFSRMLHTVIPNVADNYRMKNFADVTYKHICRSAIRASQFRETSQGVNFCINFCLSLSSHIVQRDNIPQVSTRITSPYRVSELVGTLLSLVCQKQKFQTTWRYVIWRRGWRGEGAGDPNLLVSNLVNIQILRYKNSARELDKPKTLTDRL